MEIRAVLFDVGDVLHQNAIGYVKEDIKTTLKLTDEQFRRAWLDLTLDLDYGRISEAEYWQRFIEQTGTTEPLPQQSLLRRAYEKHLVVNKDVLEIASSIKSSGRSLGILSNNIVPHVNYLTSIGLFKDFPPESRVFSCEVGFRKPERSIYLLAADRVGVRPDEAVFIDDKEKMLKQQTVLEWVGFYLEIQSNF